MVDANRALVASGQAASRLAPTGFDHGEEGCGPYASQADAWNDALEKAAQIVERYNAGFADPECGGAPVDIRGLKRTVLAKARGEA